MQPAQPAAIGGFSTHPAKLSLVRTNLSLVGHMPGKSQSVSASKPAG
jgi:hypothetical protein